MPKKKKTAEPILKSVSISFSKYPCIVEIVKGSSIELFAPTGKMNMPVLHNRFVVGDQAEYDSYNLRYYGEIIGITEKSVIIKDKYCSRSHRLKIKQFVQRNIDFNLARVEAHNREISISI